MTAVTLLDQLDPHPVKAERTRLGDKPVTVQVIHRVQELVLQVVREAMGIRRHEITPQTEKLLRIDIALALTERGESGGKIVLMSIALGKACGWLGLNLPANEAQTLFSQVWALLGDA